MKAKKNSRNIVVNGVKYRWRATGNDGYICFTIWPDALPGPAITGNLNYHESLEPKQLTATGHYYYTHNNQIVITNRLIRRIIVTCQSKHAYDPTKTGKEISLRNADAFIDLSDAVQASDNKAPEA